MPARAEKRRLDQELVARGLVATRSQAQSYIRQGLIRVNGRVETKPGTPVRPDAVIEFVRAPRRYVGRGAWKLAHALDAFGVDPRARVCLDVGASTGGFTQVLLERGARRVYAVDVGYGQLDPILRSDPRVVLMERTNARYLTRDQIPDPLGLVTVDVSFISVTKILPALVGLDLAGDLLILVKPQFELSPREVARGGRVRDPALWWKAVAAVARAARDLGCSLHGFEPAPIPGARGNREFFLHLRFPSQPGWDLARLQAVAQPRLRDLAVQEPSAPS